MKIAQMCARLEFGDAVSNHVIEIDRALRGWGFETSIYANTMDEYGRQIASPDTAYAAEMGSEDDLLIYHYSLFCPNHKYYQETKNRRIFIYHNITPPEFFAPYDKGVAEFCRSGLDLLPALADCDLALGDSEFNRLELVSAGFDAEKTGVLPIFMDLDALKKRVGKESVMAPYTGSFKMLFVGRTVPNKRIEDLLRAFYYYNRCINPDSHLFITGASWVERYDAQLRWLIDSMRLWANVHMTGRVSDSALATCYSEADLFLSMSEHEGFSVPLVESMALDLPIVAYESTAIPYTLNGGGLTFNRKEFPLIGELVEMVRTDERMREAILSSQRKRVESFHPDLVRATLKEAVARVMEMP